MLLRFALQGGCCFRLRDTYAAVDMSYAYAATLVCHAADAASDSIIFRHEYALLTLLILICAPLFTFACCARQRAMRCCRLRCRATRCYRQELLR